MIGSPGNQTGIIISQPDKDCGTGHNTKAITITDDGAIKGVITITFGCGQCAANSPDA